MPQRRLLYVNAISMYAYRWQGGRLHAEGDFKADGEGVGAFIEYLARHRQSRYSLLVDVADEGFQFESLPHALGRDHAALLQRKLSQHFPDTTFRVACVLGRQRTGRRDDEFLFSALTRPQLLEPWLAALRNSESCLSGIYSPFLLSSRLVAACLGKSTADNSQCLLLTQTHAGLRVSFLANGQLHFSRLTPLAVNSLEEPTRTCGFEALRTYHYLLGQRLIERDVALQTLVLAHPAQIAAFRATCLDTGELNFRFIDILAAATRLGLKTFMQDSCCDLLFLHLMAGHPPRQQFAPASERRFFRFRQLRSAINAIGASMLLACLLISARQLIEYGKLRDQTALMSRQAVVIGHQYEEVLKTLPPMPLGKDALRTLVGRYEDLAKHSANPQEMYLRISQALEQAPQIELARIDWQAERDVSADVFAKLPLALKNDEAGMKKIIGSFVAGLGKDGDLQVDILKQPFDDGSAKLLKSGSGVEAHSEAPIFALRIVQKL